MQPSPDKYTNTHMYLHARYVCMYVCGYRLHFACANKWMHIYFYIHAHICIWATKIKKHEKTYTYVDQYKYVHM